MKKIIWLLLFSFTTGLYANPSALAGIAMTCAAYICLPNWCASHHFAWERNRHDSFGLIIACCCPLIARKDFVNNVFHGHEEEHCCGQRIIKLNEYCTRTCDPVCIKYGNLCCCCHEESCCAKACFNCLASGCTRISEENRSYYASVVYSHITPPPSAAHITPPPSAAHITPPPSAAHMDGDPNDGHLINQSVNLPGTVQ